VLFKYDRNMKMINSIEDFPDKETFAALTIGNFDGIHLGHQRVLKRLIDVAEKNDALSTVLTFSNHPSTVLKPNLHTRQLTTTNQRLDLLEEIDIDIVIFLEFTRDFSRQTAEEFLNKLANSMNLQYLVLGHDSKLGKDREGDEEIVRDYALKHGLSVEYLEPLHIGNKPVSSSAIRQAIEKGDFPKAEKLLGRKYSLKLPVKQGKGLGKQIGFSTANFDVHGLAIPPLGVYSVWLKENGKIHDSVANLGYAPTVKGTSFPELEVHVIDKKIDLGKGEAEIIFHRFIRHEKKFDSIDELKNQISSDIETAKSQLQVGASEP
jgi:riboflavin kinase / FMN adenylyltransferase